MNYYRVTVEVADNPEYTNSTKYGSTPEVQIPEVDAWVFGEIVYRTLDKHEGIPFEGFTLPEVQR